MTPPPLKRAALAGLGPGRRPLIDQRALRPRIVHFGLGAFHLLKIPERWLDALRALRAAGAATPTPELAVAAWVNATWPDGAGRQVFGTTDPATEVLARCWQVTSDPSALVASLLRVVGATDLAEHHGLTSAVAAHLPALQAGRIEI